jgi:prephenate dehydrogenase
VEHAEADLYSGRQVILTPTERTLTAQLQRAQDVWTALGSRVTSMSPESHDAAFAAVSHLPHLLAFTLINSITGQAHADTFLSLAGPGFRDFTRIAASDPKVWRDILLANREELLAQSSLFQQALQRLEKGMREGNAQAVEDMLTLASETRKHWRMGAQRASKTR